MAESTSSRIAGSVDRNRRLIEFAAVDRNLGGGPVHRLGQRLVADLIGDDVHVFAQRRLEIVRVQQPAVGLEEFDAGGAVQNPQSGHACVVVLSCHVPITPVGRFPMPRGAARGSRLASTTRMIAVQS